jgi:hypothetical protein
VIDKFFSDKKEKPELFRKEDTGWERWRIIKHSDP